MKKYACVKCGKEYYDAKICYCEGCGSEVKRYYNRKKIAFVTAISSILLVLVVFVCVQVYQYTDGPNVKDFYGKTVPLYDTTIVVTEDNLCQLEVVDPENYEIENDKWDECTYCFSLLLVSDLTRYREHGLYMTPAFYVTYKYSLSGWELVSINKNEIYDKYWENDKVFPKKARSYPSVQSNDYDFYGDHWTCSVISDACEDEMPGLVDYMYFSVIREYECFEVKDDGNYVRCRIKAEHFDMQDGSVDDWEIYCTLTFISQFYSSHNVFNNKFNKHKDCECNFG